jgi:A118 family predicted phage portal protein
MMQRFFSWLREALKKMLNINNTAIKRAMGADVAVSGKMQEAIALWMALYQDEAPWLENTNTQTLGLPAAIASELSRLCCVEYKAEVTGDSQRAAFLDEEFKRQTKELRDAVERACASGGLIFKPYVDGGHLVVDAVPAWRFFPTAFNARREITGAAFVEQVQRGRMYYTRLEHHAMTDEGYVIRNRAFRSFSASEIGAECPLDAVDEWSQLEPELVIRYKDGKPPEKMLFSFFRMPMANKVDLDSPMGVSVYSRAVDLIRDADEQYTRILWEYEGSELAVDASVGALKRTGPDGKPATLPKHQQRLFRELAIDNGDKGDLYEVFSPAIRDSSLFNGLDKILKRIEFACSLAYGTLSDPANVDKTAEEIRTSKQRSYTAVTEMQTALEAALKDLLWVDAFYCDLYKLVPAGDYDITITWGDGILEDPAAEFARRLQLVEAGHLKAEKLIAWYFGVSEEAAAEYIPAGGAQLTFKE